MDLKKIASPIEMSLVAVVFLLVTVAFFRLFFSPQSVQIKELSEKVKQLKTEQENLKKQNELFAQQNLKKQQAVTVDKSDNTQLLILAGQKKPVLTQLSELLETIVTPGFAHGIELSSLDSKPPQAAAGFKQIPLHMQGQASFDAFIQFIRRLSGLQALVTIDSLALTVPNEERSRVDFEMTTTLYQTEETSNAGKK